jgi:hypothetical protein
MVQKFTSYKLLQTTHLNCVKQNCGELQSTKWQKIRPLLTTIPRGEGEREKEKEREWGLLWEL